jgi:hypothetical protein
MRERLGRRQARPPGRSAVVQAREPLPDDLVLLGDRGQVGLDASDPVGGARDLRVGRLDPLGQVLELRADLFQAGAARLEGCLRPREVVLDDRELAPDLSGPRVGLGRRTDHRGAEEDPLSGDERRLRVLAVLVHRLVERVREVDVGEHGRHEAADRGVRVDDRQQGALTTQHGARGTAAGDREDGAVAFGRVRDGPALLLVDDGVRQGAEACAERSFPSLLDPYETAQQADRPVPMSLQEP